MLGIDGSKQTLASALLDPQTGPFGKEGAVTAAAVASRRTSRRLEAADQFVAYVGRDIGVMQSGPRNGQRGRTKEGEAAWRRLFSRCAQSTVRPPSRPFRERYAREVARGRKHPAARCLIARKLARTGWSLVAHEKDFDAERLFKQADRAVRKHDCKKPVDIEP